MKCPISWSDTEEEFPLPPDPQLKFTSLKTMSQSLKCELEPEV